jgi:DNA-binding response OmpR family regulator
MQAPARILIVDDSPTILKVVSAILARHGYEPSVAYDGFSALELIRREPKYDLVLLDFVMPRMNGYQFCRELRSSPTHRSLPVVLMSAKGDKIRGQFVQQTGAVDAITKPFDARALVAVIEGALAKTAEGRARPVPEGNKMPAEETLTDSEPPSAIPRQQWMNATLDVAQHVAHVVTPALLALSPKDQGSEAAIFSAVARSITSDVVNTLSLSLRGIDSTEGAKEIMSGDIAAFPLGEILQVLQMQKQTGVIRVTNNRATVAISMRQGLIDFVHSRGTSEEFLLGRYFLEKGLVTRTDLERVIEAKSATGQLLGDALVASGTVSKEDLNEALTRQSSELIYDVLRWPHGRFSFAREPFRPEAESAKLELGIAGLVLEGFRRVDEWRLMEGTINFDQVVLLDQMVLDSVNPEKLTRIDKLVLGAVNGTSTVNEIIKESAVSSFDAIKALYQFLQSRVLRPRAP